jgi:hypothetical protein
VEPAVAAAAGCRCDGTRAVLDSVGDAAATAPKKRPSVVKLLWLLLLAPASPGAGEGRVAMALTA